MIRINLLPQAYRRGHRVSTKVLAATFGAALAVCSSMGWFGVVYFGELAAAEAEHEAVTAELAEKQKRATYYDQLEANRKDYFGRVQTAQDIGRSRRVWSKQMDELIDVVNNDGDTERHLAWFSGMTVKDDPRKGTNVTLPGAVQGTEMARVGNLHEDIERASFAKELASKSDPAGKLEVDKTREPAESFAFQLQLMFQPRLPDPKTQKPPAKPAGTPAETEPKKE